MPLPEPGPPSTKATLSNDIVYINCGLRIYVSADTYFASFCQSYESPSNGSAHIFVYLFLRGGGMEEEKDKGNNFVGMHGEVHLFRVRM